MVPFFMYPKKRNNAKYICLNMEVTKDAVCVAVMQKIGLVYIPGMPSKEAV